MHNQEAVQLTGDVVFAVDLEVGARVFLTRARDSSSEHVPIVIMTKVHGHLESTVMGNHSNIWDLSVNLELQTEQFAVVVDQLDGFAEQLNLVNVEGHSLDPVCVAMRRLCVRTGRLSSGCEC